MDVSEIIQELNNHGFEDTDSTQKMLVINDTLWDIESREPWPFLEKTTTLNFNGSSEIPTNMPTDFKAVMWLYDTVNAVTLQPERLSTIRDRFGASLTQVTDPLMYYFVGSSMRLYPVPPSATGRYRLDYFATQPELTSSDVEASILLPKRHHRIISLGALWRLYKLEDDPENAQQFQEDYEGRITTMREDLFRRQHQRADQIFVTDEDDEYPVIYY